MVDGRDAGIDAEVPGPPVTLDLRFERGSGTQAFDAIAEWLDDRGTAVAGPTIGLDVDRGTVDVGMDGVATTATVTPGDSSGLFEVTATGGGMVVERTAIVLGDVDDAWGQPELVRGLVNTPGWEDGASIAPDGQTLLLQYLPVGIACLNGSDAGSSACDVVGPTEAPERPNMPGQERVRPDHTFEDGCPSLGLDPLPSSIIVPPVAEWAFTRQPDGSFAQPRPVFYDGADGCFSSFGLMFVPGGSGDVAWAFDSPLPGGTGPKLHAATLALDAPTPLGVFGIDAGGGLELAQQPGAQLELGETGSEGNPYVAVGSDGRRLVIFDDETGRRDLMFAQETAPGANTWTAVQTIPAPVSDPVAQESQPFLDGTNLVFRRELAILQAAWTGGPMQDAASWATPTTLLGPDADPSVGHVIVVGEPSIATTAAGRELYFIYGQVVGPNDVDLGVGVVHAR